MWSDFPIRATKPQRNPTEVRSTVSKSSQLSKLMMAIRCSNIFLVCCGSLKLELSASIVTRLAVCDNGGCKKETITLPLQRGSDVAEKEGRGKVKVSPSKTDRHDEND